MLYEFVHDAKRFTLFDQSTIRDAPLQVYASAIIFSPKKSIVREQFENTLLPRWIQKRPKIPQAWSKTRTTFEGHTSEMISVAFAPDGKRLVSGAYDCAVHLWDVDSGAMLNTLLGTQSEVKALEFAPDGSDLVLGVDDKMVHVWHAECNELLVTFGGHKAKANHAIFSPSGNLIASGDEDGTLLVWYRESTDDITTRSNLGSSVTSLAFSTNGTKLAIGLKDGPIALIDFENNSHKAFQFGNGTDLVRFSPNGKFLALKSSLLDVIHILDAETTQLLTEIHCDDLYFDIAVSPSSEQLVVAGGELHLVLLFDVLSGEELRTFEHPSSVVAVAFSPGGNCIASGTEDSIITLWDLHSSMSHACLSESMITSLTASDGIEELSDKIEEFTNFTVSPRGRYLSTVSSRYLSTVPSAHKVRIYDANTCETLDMLTGGARENGHTIFSPDDRHLTLLRPDSAIALWNTDPSVMLRKLRGHTGAILALVFSPDSKQLASASEDLTVRLWDAELGKLLFSINVLDKEVYDMAFSPGCKKLALCLRDTNIRLCDLQEPGQFTELTHPSLDGLYVSALAFSSNNEYLALGYNLGTISVWDVESAKKLTKRVFQDQTRVDCISVLPDSTQPQLAAASYLGWRGEIRVRLWNVQSPEEEDILKIKRGVPVHQLSLSTDRKYLTTNRGIVKIGASAISHKLQEYGEFALFVSEERVKIGQQTLLWLPVRFRTSGWP